MILYNVTVKVDVSISDAWVKWMKEEHMPELMETGLFTEYRLMHLFEQDDAEGITYSAQYYCEDMDRYNEYIDKHAPRLRKAGIDKFGDKFVAFRTIMKAV